MRYRDHVPANPASVSNGKWLAKMQGYLVPKKIEIHPSIGTAAFLASQHASIEGARCIQIMYVKGFFP